MKNNQSQQALIRYKAIHYIEDQTRDGVSLAKALRNASLRPWPDEDGRFYAVRTLEDWWYAYKKGNFSALYKKKRKDAGSPRLLDKSTVHWILSQRADNPKIRVKVLYEHWQKQGKKLPSISTIYRLLHHHGYDRKSLNAGRTESGPSKAFESACANDLWMVDFSPGPVLNVSGEVIKTQLCLLVDDHSRLIPYGAYYRKGDTESFHHCLQEAILRRGLPVKLYTDNGGPFVNDHTKLVCANLGIRLLHAKPYHSWSKGKVERLIKTIQDRFESLLRLEGNQADSLGHLNERFAHWIQCDYHQRKHGSTQMAPEVRYRNCLEHIRNWDSDQDIERCFYTKVQRRVRKDGTVLLDNKLYEVDLSLRGLKVQLHYDPFTKKRIEVYSGERPYGLAAPVDLQVNAEHKGEENYER